MKPLLSSIYYGQLDKLIETGNKKAILAFMNSYSPLHINRTCTKVMKDESVINVPDLPKPLGIQL